MPHNCQWSELARDDLRKIRYHIASDNLAASLKIVQQIIKATEEQLMHHVHIGRAGRVFNTRELILKRIPYIVAYEVIGDTVQILGVMHTAQHWPDEFKPDPS